jgi:Flp pilus assembly protein TadD
MNTLTGVAVDGSGNVQVATGLLEEALSGFRGGQYESAIRLAGEAVSRVPSCARARLIHGVALSKAGLVARGIDELVVASRQAPVDAHIRYNLAVVLQQAGRTDSAMVEYAACLAIDPDYKDALWNYGDLLRSREHFGKALQCFERLEQLEGGRRVGMAHRMAVCCSYLGRDDQAYALFEEQIARYDEPVTHWEYANHLLARGKFDDAWPLYARRFDAGVSIQLGRPVLPYPQWRGEYERDATLLVVGEQGAGDEILFSAFLPQLALRACEAGMHVVVACRTSLIRLFEASFREISFVAYEVAQPANFDRAALAARTVQVMIGDLPMWLAKPLPSAYLTPNLDDVKYMRELLPHRKGLRVGLAWLANPFAPQANRRQRNVNPAILNAHLRKLQGDYGDIQYYSLLDESHRDALAQLADVQVTDMSAYLTDFSRTAALMNELDVVVTVCTSTANLAGALGRDTRVLLQKHADWRWFGNITLYPRVRIYQKQIPYDWFSPVSRLFAELVASCAISSNSRKNPS